MKLEALTLKQCERVRLWRNAEMECWRTPFMLTEEMQADFYKRCCDRNSPHRYWAIVGEKEDYPPGSVIKVTKPLPAILAKIPSFFIGMGGITYIQWENRIGEITLIIDPDCRKNGNGEKAVDLLLDQAVNHLNLQTVFGECYYCNKGYDFWRTVVEKYFNDTAKTICTTLPNRKYWQGKYYASLYFSIDKDDFNEKHNSNK